ncbi:MAG: dihydroorotase [Oxalobacter sp.]|nr:dihydroorotase [Oxalobacter sp.]
MTQQNTKTLTIIQPDDFHLHLRDGEVLQSTVTQAAKQFRRAIIMPNLKPPITTTKQATEYRKLILAQLPSNTDFQPLMTLYLTDNTPPEEIVRAKESGIVHGIKLYPAGATTNSDAGVTSLSNCIKTLEEMQKQGIPLLMHGEVTDPDVDIFDREAVFIDKVLIPLRKMLPDLKVVFEHITTKAAAEYVTDAEGFIGATVTPQHLLFNRNHLLVGGIHPHYYCLPILKREENRQALLKAVTQNNRRFFAGTDSAPHAKGAKENACGCAGCYSASHAIELYATVFEQQNALEHLEWFTAINGPKFYNLAVNRTTITLEKRDWQIPESLPFGSDKVVPLMAGENLTWKLV